MRNSINKAKVACVLYIIALIIAIVNLIYQAYAKGNVASAIILLFGIIMFNKRSSTKENDVNM